MSKYTKGYMGDQIGKLGPAVGARWKGRTVMRSYQKYVRNPRTEAQQLVRSRFRVLSKLASAFHSANLLGLRQSAVSAAMTEGNIFSRLNWDKVTAVSPDEVSVNFSALSLSDGTLPEATFGAVDFGEGSHLHVEATLSGGADQPGASEQDQVYLFAYCPDRYQGVLGSPVPRTADKVSVNVPASWDGMEIQLYGFAIGAADGQNAGRSSATAYCGSGEVA